MNQPPQDTAAEPPQPASPTPSLGQSWRATANFSIIAAIMGALMGGIMGSTDIGVVPGALLGAFVFAALVWCFVTLTHFFLSRARSAR